MPSWQETRRQITVLVYLLASSVLKVAGSCRLGETWMADDDEEETGRACCTLMARCTGKLYMKGVVFTLNHTIISRPPSGCVPKVVFASEAFADTGDQVAGPYRQAPSVSR